MTEWTSSIHGVNQEMSCKLSAFVPRGWDFFFSFSPGDHALAIASYLSFVPWQESNKTDETQWLQYGVMQCGPKNRKPQDFPFPDTRPQPTARGRLGIATKASRIPPQRNCAMSYLRILIWEIYIACCAGGSDISWCGQRSGVQRSCYRGRKHPWLGVSVSFS